jgi:type II secretory pathway pseudopilin PulG
VAPARQAIAQAAHSRPSSRARGYSLLELLVVMFVIITITSMVSLVVSSGGEDIRLEAQVRQLADTAQYALDEAQFTGRDYGLLLERVEEEGEWVYAWTWRERVIDGWRLPESGKDLFEEQRLPVGLEMELEIENAPFSELELDSEGERRGPQVVLYASGETTVGAINVRRTSDSELLWRIEWDLLGRFEVMRRGEPDDGELL